MITKGLVLLCVFAVTQAMFLPPSPKFHGKKFPMKRPIVQKKYVPIIKKVAVPKRVVVPVYIERKVEVPVYVDREVPVYAGAGAGAFAGAGAIAGAGAGAGAGAIDVALHNTVNDADHVSINVGGAGVAAEAGAAAGAIAGAGAGAFSGFDNGFDNGLDNGFDNSGGFIDSGIQGSLARGHDIGISQLPGRSGQAHLPIQQHGKAQTGHKTGGHFQEISHAQDIVHF